MLIIIAFRSAILALLLVLVAHIGGVLCPREQAVYIHAAHTATVESAKIFNQSVSQLIN